MPEKKHFLIVDDQEIIRESLTIKLSLSYPGADIKACSSCEACCQLLETYTPDIIFMDISMPGMDGIDCTKLILSRWPDLKIAGFSMNDNDRILNKMMKAGAKGYILKTDSGDETKLAIEDILDGKVFISKNVKR